MAEFEPAFEATLVNEGFPGFNRDNNSADVCAGINRASWPGWEGWPVIDTLKAKGLDRHGINDALRKDARLRPMVEKFYQRNFWPPMFSQVNDQRVANWLFDKSVNMYITQAVKLMQRAAGVTGDGVLGPKTLAAINAADPAVLVKAAHDQAVEFYQDLHKKNPAKYPADMVDRA